MKRLCAFFRWSQRRFQTGGKASVSSQSKRWIGACIGGTTLIAVVMAPYVQELWRDNQVPATEELTRQLLLAKKDSWALSEKQIIAAIQRMKKDDMLGYSEDDVLPFLYAKGLFKDENSVSRVYKFKDILNPDGAEVNEKQKARLKEALKRLRRIVVEGETGFDPGRTAFDQFLELEPAWKEETSFVVFRDHPLLKGKPHAYAERVQKSSLCYMHAPIMLQHFLVQMTNDKHVKMLDMAAYLRQHASAETLEEHIWKDQGGDSRGFLKQILAPGSSVQDIRDLILGSLGWMGADGCNWRKLLERYGPLLVSGFGVHKEFYSDERVHVGNPKGEPTGRHAMVLVGYRRVDSSAGSSDRFLLQNWWKEKPFVEVDAQYLESCEATIYVVKSPQPNIPDCFPVNPNAHVEADLLDARETSPPERKL